MCSLLSGEKTPARTLLAICTKNLSTRALLPLKLINGLRLATPFLKKSGEPSKIQDSLLDELLLIMDLCLKKEMKVVPIFYGVDPSCVRNQIGSFSLDKHHGSDKVTNWRQALTQIASIAGKDSAVCEDEATMIEEIVEGISNQLLAMKQVDFSNIVGINIHMERLSPLLSMESGNEVRMIGLWGMGGIGKTTIAKCLFDWFSRGFPARCFLENVSKIHRTHGFSYLTTRFLSTTLGLSEKKMNFPGAELGPHELKARLENRKVFLVLDNADDMKQMHALAQDSSWFGPGSRIIITTRDKGLLSSYGVRTIYEVKCLDTDDSLQIFNRIAFEGGLPPPSDCYNQLSVRASRLAQEVLKISYDGLEEADKRVFLHVACLFSGELLQRAITLLNDDELQGCLGDNQSVACMALHNVHMCEMPEELYLDGYAKNDHNNLKFLKVHRHSDHVDPMLHFMRRYIFTFGLVEVSLRYSNLTSLMKGTKWLLHLRRLDLTGSKNLEQLPDLSHAVNLEEVITQGCKRLKRIQSPLIVLYFSSNEVEMRSTTYLSIGGNIQIQMVGLAGNVDHLCFSSEKQAPHVLIRMDQQPLLFYDHKRRTKKVEQQRHRPNRSEFHGFNAMEITRFNYKSDAAAASFLCHSLYMFPCLKELNLFNLNIKVIPDDVSSLQLLEKLDWNGNDFETLPETMNQLLRLKHVSLCNCRRLKAFPELVLLETIKLSGCMSLQSLLETSHVEPGLGRYQWLELWVDGCTKIQSISDQLRHLIKLSYLDLSSHEFETLPSSITELSYLGTLCINKCTKLKSVQGVPLSLKYLYAHGCESLETVSLPLDHSIKHLDLSPWRHIDQIFLSKLIENMMILSYKF
ncbi:hypothetical protein HID58_047313 [Brassica napus]|uniref:TIR domain-containing protein n=1 Tax=Brassica napus TaxID=3708 RepID=A0ABQ8B0D2_BRANA|nr:hypothetical protein HID58_047313 [Brassica napus]